MTSASYRRVARVAPATKRGHSKAFSASNIGPQNVGDDIDPFIGIDHFIMRVPVFPPHPHAGFSALTYLFEDSEGSFTNRDSLGHSLLIGPGDLHWTTAGRGIIHEEIPEVVGQRDHGLQIFVNLPRVLKHVEPSVHHLSRAETPVVDDGGTRIRTLAGRSNGAVSPLTPPTTVTLLDVLLGPNATFSHALPPSENAFAYVLSGALDVGLARTVGARQVVTFAHDGDAIRVRSGSGGAWLFVFAGAPLREPVLARGPFVMTTEAELENAYRDYQSGRMGRLAATASDAWLDRS